MHPASLPFMRSAVALLAAGLLSACDDAGRAGSEGACRVDAVNGLAGVAMPTSAELTRLVADARLQFAAGKREPAEYRRLRDRLSELERALGAGTPDQRCRAYVAARAALEDLGQDADADPRRSSIALVLDITAASLAHDAR